MLAGCVPVIVQPAVLQPFEGVLPFSNFSLRLGSEDVPILHEILAEITPERHEALRRGVRLHAAAFSWDGEHGRAYEHLRFSLCQRAARAEGKPEVACFHLRPSTLPRTRYARGGVQGWHGT